MAIDLPPLESLPATPVEVVERYAEGSSAIELLIGGEAARLIGATRLDQHQLRATLAAAKDLDDAQRRILDAYADAGWRNVAVTVVRSAGQPSLWVIESRLVEISAPAELEPYFARFEGSDSIRHSPFNRAARMAQWHARRAGFDAYSTYSRDGADPHIVKLAIDVAPRRRSAWDYSWGLGNTGNRFLGRNFVGLGVSWTGKNALRAGLSFDSALPDPDDSAADTQYFSVAPFIDKVFPFGVLRGFASYDEYRFQGDGRGRRPLPPPADSEPAPRALGRTLAFGISAQELLLAGPGASVLASQGLRWVDDRLQRGGDDGPQVRERFLIVEAGADVQLNWFVHPAVPNPSFRLGLRQGIDGQVLDQQQDAQPGFTIVDYGFSTRSRWPGPVVLQLDLTASHALDAVPQYEEWVLGGFDRLSAWLPGVAVGDRGVLSRLELSHRLGSPTARGARLRAFVEQGTARFAQRESQRARLADAGIGVDVYLPGRWQIEVVAAQPLDSSSPDSAALRSNEVDAFVRVRHVWDAP